MPIASAQNMGLGTYKVTLTDGTVIWVPQDSANADYVRLQAWVAAGGVISQ